MRTILIVSFLIVCHFAQAATYFFSSSGNDSHTWAQARNPATPWRSINKLNQIFPQLLPGDSVLFKRGDEFYGAIKISRSGTAASPIVLGAFGKGNNPVITGFSKVLNWINTGGNIWESATPVSSLSSVNMLTIDGVQFEMGRYPNANTPNKGYLTISSHIGRLSLTASSLQSTPNWSGATAVVRTGQYIIDTCKISSHSGNTITLINGTTYEPKNGYGFFIQNHEKTLDQHGEWFFNPSTRKLKIYSAGNPAAHTIKLSTIDNLITCYDVDYITIENLSLEGANKLGTYHYSASNNTVKNSSIQFCGDMAILSNHGANINFTAENNYISDAGNYGINCRFSGDNQVIRKNVIRNIGLFPGMGGTGTQHRTAFANNSGKNHLIEFNTIDSIGFCGIRAGGDFTTVKNNVVSNFTLVVDDGGGIYSYSNGKVITGSKIINNLVFNGPGAPEGTTNTTFGASSGIYTDDNSNGLEISGNSVWNCGKAGLYIHNSYNLVIRNNLFFDNDQAQVEFVHDNAANSTIHNIVYKDNIAFSKSTKQFTAFFYTRLNDIANFGQIDSNYYVRPLNETGIIREITSLYTASGLATNHSLATWKTKYQKDIASKGSPKIYPSTANIEDSVLFAFNATNTAKTVSLPGQYIDVKNKVYTTSCLIPAFSSVILFKTSGPHKAPEVKITSPASNSSYNTPVDIIINASATTLNGGIAKVEFFHGTTLIGADSTSPYAVTWKDVKPGTYSLTAKATDNTSIFSSSAPVNITIKNPPEAPTIKIVSPGDHDVFPSGETILISASAAVTEGMITKVEFYAGSTLLGSDDSSPYTFSWENPTPGLHQISAKAITNDQLSSFSSTTEITILEKIIQPQITIATPSDNSEIVLSDQNTSITIEVNLEDPSDIVTRVDFYSGREIIGSSNSPPYSVIASNLNNGQHQLKAVAVTTTNETIFSSIITILVSRENIAPNVKLTSPAQHSVYDAPGTIILTAEASDTDGIVSKVEFYYGATLIAEDYSAPYTYTWSNVLGGKYSLTARAIDDKGKQSTTEATSIQVNTFNDPPTITITSPGVQQNFEFQDVINIEANAYDDDGIVKRVDFFLGDSLIGADNSYPFSFTLTGSIAGNHTLSAIAIDNEGKTSTKASINITINAEKMVYEKIKVGPNPATNQILVYGSSELLAEKSIVTIARSDGNVVLKKEIEWVNGVLSVDIKFLQTGVYTMLLISSDTHFAKKFVKH